MKPLTKLIYRKCKLYGLLQGGHSKLILEALPNCHLLCIDRDVEALRACRTNLSDYISQGRVTLSHGSYAEAKKLLHLAGLPSKVDGVLVDLGVSSHQLDSAHRGFSYRMDSPLDMRFNQTDGANSEGKGKERVYTSSDALVKLSEVELAKIIRDYGEEPKWRKAGQAIKDYINKEGAIKTTGELMVCLDKLGGGPKDKKKRAARVFQVRTISQCSFETRCRYTLNTLLISLPLTSKTYATIPSFSTHPPPSLSSGPPHPCQRRTGPPLSISLSHCQAPEPWGKTGSYIISLARGQAG
jgi:16S rRNA (cytosine(1402)-N(4))-methyltransferase